MKALILQVIREDQKLINDPRRKEWSGLTFNPTPQVVVILNNLPQCLKNV